MSNFKEILQSKTFIIIAAGLLLFLLFVQFKQYRVRRNIQIEIQNLSKQSDLLQKNNQDLQSMLAYLKTDAYKEKAAREQLSMRKPGETVYSFSAINPETNQSSEIAETKMTDQSNPIKWWNYFFKAN